MKKNKKILRNLLIIAIIIYIAFVFIDQQKTLNEYSKNIAWISLDKFDEIRRIFFLPVLEYRLTSENFSAIIMGKIKHNPKFETIGFSKKFGKQ